MTTPTWSVKLADEMRPHTVRADGFREDGVFTVFHKAGQPPVFAAQTCLIVSITREPDDGDPEPAEPEPEPDQPITVNVSVSGGVLSERDLRDLIDKHLTEAAHRAIPRGLSGQFIT
jgi:hypothetical protein